MVHVLSDFDRCRCRWSLSKDRLPRSDRDFQHMVQDWDGRYNMVLVFFTYKCELNHIYIYSIMYTHAYIYIYMYVCMHSICIYRHIYIYDGIYRASIC